MDSRLKTNDNAALGNLGTNEPESQRDDLASSTPITATGHAASSASPTTVPPPAPAITDLSRDTAWKVAQDMAANGAQPLLLVRDPQGPSLDFLLHHGAYVPASWAAGDMQSNAALRPSRVSLGWATAVALILMFAVGVTCGGFVVRALLA